MMQFKGIEFPADFQGNVKKAFATRQNALDAKCIALMEDYTPIAMPGGYTKASPHKWVRFENRGKMSKSHRQESPGVIINTEPKARREYYTNKGGSGGKRGKYWFRRCVADHKETLRKTAKEGK
jgi:hypothetical protein